MIKRLLFLAGIVSVLSFLSLTPDEQPFYQSVEANGVEELSGYAWSDMPDGSDENKTSTHPRGRGAGYISFKGTAINGAPYGVKKLLDGRLEGYAWSPNIGWIRFGGLSEIPPTVSGNEAVNATFDGTTLKGWARACSVYVSNCSGALISDLVRGGWDGWISLKGENYGVTRTGVSGQYALDGYAWGDMVLGWISFNVSGATGGNTPETCESTGRVCGGSPTVYSCSPQTIPGAFMCTGAGDGLTENVTSSLYNNQSSCATPVQKCSFYCASPSTRSPAGDSCVCPVGYTMVSGACVVNTSNTDFDFKASESDSPTAASSTYLRVRQNSDIWLRWAYNGSASTCTISETFRDDKSGTERTINDPISVRVLKISNLQTSRKYTMTCGAGEIRGPVDISVRDSSQSER